MLDATQYGHVDGAPPEASALSGRPLKPGSPIIHLGDGYLVGVTPKEWRSMSGVEVEALKAEWAAQFAQAKADTQASVPKSYDDMSLDELKQVAQDKGVDISGRKSKIDIAQALRVADVTARVAENPPPSAAAQNSEEPS